jgi:hypothetical protein
MYRTDRVLEKVFFGFDLDCFYLQIDLVPDKITNFPAAGSIQLQFTSPERCSLVLRPMQNGEWRLKTVD